MPHINAAMKIIMTCLTWPMLFLTNIASMKSVLTTMMNAISAYSLIFRHHISRFSERDWKNDVNDYERVQKLCYNNTQRVHFSRTCKLVGSACLTYQPEVRFFPRVPERDLCHIFSIIRWEELEIILYVILPMFCTITSLTVSSWSLTREMLSPPCSELKRSYRDKKRNLRTSNRI